MSKEQYQWMLGLAAAWLQQEQQRSDDDQSGPRVERVVGVAGHLKGMDYRAANDLKAVLFILLLLLAHNSAKSGANFFVFVVIPCKMRAANFFVSPPANPHQLTVSAFFLGFIDSAKTITSPHVAATPAGGDCGSH